MGSEQESYFPIQTILAFPGNAFLEQVLESVMPEIWTLYLHVLFVWKERRKGRDTIQRAKKNCKVSNMI